MRNLWRSLQSRFPYVIPVFVLVLSSVCKLSCLQTHQSAHVGKNEMGGEVGLKFGTC